MKKLPVQASHYKYLLKSYAEYLQVLGYADNTVKRYPLHVRELLHWLEQKNIRQITMVESSHIHDFVIYLKRRPNQRTEGAALSSSNINNIISAMNLFIRFLNSTGKYLVETTGEWAEKDVAERIILTVAEIKQLYEASFLAGRQNTLAMGQRDRAIIAVFYGCGLRRSEGGRLNLTDIDLQRRLLFVRKGKGNKQRYVPIATKHLQDIKDYLQQGREWFLYHHGNCETWSNKRHGTSLIKKQNADDSAFFISVFGERMYCFENRLKQLRSKAEITKNVTLHGLRHSIATHLLQSGMEIEEIAKFLGHSSLASTQIYTHIINEHDREV